MDPQSAADTGCTTFANTSSVRHPLSRQPTQIATFDPSSTDFDTFATQIESAIEHSLHAYLPRMIKNEINGDVEEELLTTDRTELKEKFAKDFASQTLAASRAQVKDVTDDLQRNTRTPSIFTLSVGHNEADGDHRVHTHKTTHVYFRPFWEVQVSAGSDAAQSTRLHGSEWFQGARWI